MCVSAALPPGPLFGSESGRFAIGVGVLAALCSRVEPVNRGRAVRIHVLCAVLLVIARGAALSPTRANPWAAWPWSEIAQPLARWVYAPGA
jgi:hypothetical protein